MHRQPAPDPGGLCKGSPMIGWHGTALGCRRRGPLGPAPAAKWQLQNPNGVDVEVISNLVIGFPLFWN